MNNNDMDKTKKRAINLNEELHSGTNLCAGHLFNSEGSPNILMYKEKVKEFPGKYGFPRFEITVSRI